MTSLRTQGSLRPVHLGIIQHLNVFREDLLYICAELDAERKAQKYESRHTGLQGLWVQLRT